MCGEEITGFFTVGFECFYRKQAPFHSDYVPSSPKVKRTMKKTICNEDSYFLYIHLAKYSEFLLFPELISIENLCENDYIYILICIVCPSVCMITLPNTTFPLNLYKYM